MKTKEELSILKNEVENLNKKLAELTDDEMKKVAGGSDREKSIMVRVVISDCGPFTGEVSIKPYLDGILLSDQEQKVDGSFDYVYVLTRGSGLAMLAVKINDKAVKNYVIDFDRKSYSQI